MLFSKARHTLEDMLLEREARTAPFLYTHAHMTYAAGTVGKLVGTKRILVYFCVVTGTICKSSRQDATLKIAVIIAPKFKPVAGKNFVNAKELFRKYGFVPRRKLSLQDVTNWLPTLTSTCDTDTQ